MCASDADLKAREPKDLEEYFKRFAANQRIEGYGITGVTMSLPCPFCAAADFITYKVIEVEAALKKGATCKECGRTAAAIFKRTPGEVAFNIVQTGGRDQPEWLVPKMPRIT